MILQKIAIENIRSYKEPIEIDIPEGRTLFQGDIGCGKSTILMAIEFALFGLGDIDGRDLLRVGKQNGQVTLEFKVKDKIYKVNRTLIRKGNKISQEAGYIEEDGILTYYAVSEMKSKILEIVNINEKIQTNTTSIIYRFGIFIPQEMMKQILYEKVDKRLEILRHVFNIEEYSTARKNTLEIIIPKLRNRINYNKGVTKDLDDKEIELRDLKNNIVSLSEQMKELTEKLYVQNLELTDLNQKRDDLGIKKDLILQLKIIIPQLKQTILKDIRDKNELDEESRKLEYEMSMIRKAQQELEKIRPIYDDYNEKKNILKNLRESSEKYDKLLKEKTSLEQTIENERKRLQLEINRLNDEIVIDTEELQEIENSLEDIKSLLNEEHEIKRLIHTLPELRKQLTRINSQASKKNTIIESEKDNIQQKQKELEQIEMMGEDAQCPKCKQTLSIDHKLKVMDELAKGKKEKENIIIFLKQEIDKLKFEQEETDNKISDLMTKETRLNVIQIRIAKLVEKKESKKKFSKKLKQKEEKIKSNRQLLADKHYLEEENERHSKITIKMNELESKKSQYEELRKIIEKYEEERIEFHYVNNFQETKRSPSVENAIKKNQTHLGILTKNIFSNSNLLQEKEILYRNNEGVMQEIQVIEADHNVLQKTITVNSLLLNSLQTKNNDFTDKQNELEDKILILREYRIEMDIFQQTYNWLEEIFVPTIEEIEKNILHSINEDFNNLFQNWFSMLVESQDINVEIDENFTPLITQDGYILSINSLSGGEKTAVALAYRLALNKMLTQKTSMEDGLLILDEPTDGFGKEQLIRLREVLDEMNDAQIILVSHERELESFVDRIYKITKEGNSSKIKLIGQ